MYSAQLTAAASFLTSIPFEQALRGRGLDSLRARLRDERELFQDMAWPDGTAPRFRLVLTLGARNAWPELLNTMRCWALQSFPSCEAVVVRTCASFADELRERLASDTIVRKLAWRVADDSPGEWLAAEPGTYVLFAKPGDLLHPSLAATLALRLRKSPRDVIVWNCCRYTRTANGAPRLAALLRRPQLQRVTLLNHDYVGRALSVRASLIGELDCRSLASHWADNGHVLKMRLAVHARAGWETHPEYLTLFPEQDSMATGTASRVAAVQPPATEVVDGLLGGPAEETGANAESPRWRPSRRAQAVSIVIPFRDRPELTLRAIASVCAQRFDGEFEIVLVNNQSSEASLARLDAGMGDYAGKLWIIRVDYPKAFNHSRQCNLGAKAARGEVVVFLNNDAELVSPDLVDGMSRWSMLDGIATVGCRIESHAGALVCAGLKARLNAGYDYHSVIEECRDLEYSYLVREVIGNTFACAAIRRDTFHQLGGLDESDFPNGYNDVEFCLRAIQKNYRHLYLGYLVLRHEPGTSRGKSDELYQKVLIRERYPWVVREGMFQLENETHLLRGVHSNSTSSPPTSSTDPLGAFSSGQIGNVLRQALGRLAGQ